MSVLNRIDELQGQINYITHTVLICTSLEKWEEKEFRSALADYKAELAQAKAYVNENLDFFVDRFKIPSDQLISTYQLS